ncbi:acetyltransferase [Xylaria flabelliformis]|nr:acetyltransferase [Xylaria flabelliformis]
MAFIRPYKDSDFDACAHICIATLPPTLAASPAAAQLSPYLWTHPYTFLSPSTCHVLDDGTGKAVGYCIGCPDVHAFVANYGRYITDILSHSIAVPDFSIRAPWIVSKTAINVEYAQRQDIPDETANPLALAQNAYRADWMVLEGKEAVTERWRATMHIDLLPAYQRSGWGRQLIDRFVASVQSSGQDYGEGEHIGVAGENSKVVPFYERMGFRVIEGGEREGNIWMVRDIEKV